MQRRKSKVRIAWMVAAVFTVMTTAAFLPAPVEADQDAAPWVAPSWADTLRNPLATGAATLNNGRDHFGLYCWPCHGDQGKGDGAAGASFPVKPADLTSAAFSSQSDGAIFWKLSTGRGNMPAYEELLDRQALWELVTYVRTLSKK